jgi:GTP-binding protein HflX
VDAHSDERHTNIQRVNEVLEEIGAVELPTLTIFNKIDLLQDVPPRIDRDARDKPVAVWLSAQTGQGCELLLQAISELLADEMVSDTFLLTPAMGRLRAMLYKSNAVVSESSTQSGDLHLSIRIPRTDFLRLLKTENMTQDQLKVVSIVSD